MFASLLPTLAGWLTALALSSAAVADRLLEAWPTVSSVSIILLFACRERGSTHSWIGTQGARALFWGVPVSGIAWWLAPALPLEALARVWMAAALGFVLLPHGAGQDLAVPWITPDDARGLDRIARAERLGYLWLAGMGRLVFLAGALHPWIQLPPAWIALGGLAMPAGYLAALVMPPLPWRFRSAQEWGEGLYGLLLGPVLTIALRT